MPKKELLCELLRFYMPIHRKQLLKRFSIIVFWTLLLQIHYSTSWRGLCLKQPYMWGLDSILNVLSIIFRHWWMFEQSLPKWSSLCQPSGKLSLRLQDWLHWKPVPNRYEQSVNKITKLDQLLCSSIDAEKWNRTGS